ncbi:group 1 glycosyl transferase [Candidatus Desulfofervidus auxilii]|uniref:Group 1 glycosyl transferase n=1 Tax=Desulfofervidus auxilii TaxID=1621989 RepID=A0A7U4QLW9_DESA2|nr:glycosyltransferase [Candidatus Desulfofervidus auxilii]AMM41762.1 group 1 glycosyl transferase [Candidatus Desulfofervidus auxilii]
MGKLEFYADIVGHDVIDHLYQLSSLLKNIKVIHVNSTRKGGGVAEILEKLVPLSQELGIDTKWEVITGNERFFHCTKSMHNALQGNPLDIPNGLLKVYEETNAQNAEKLCPALEEADVVFIHDPQPAPLLKFCPKRKGKWVWRCHIDISRPYRPVWKYLRDFIKDYDASIFHLADFAQPLPHPLYLIPPSIDPLSEKNKELEEEKVHSIYEKFNINPELPTIVQVSRFDRFKDPLGVIRAYRLAKEFIPSLQLILAGGGAADDPETEIVLAEVKEVASGDPNIHVLFLPPGSDRIINAIQRGADIILQKSIREGFGLTVTEGMWKGKPVIGGNTGGIRLQVINHHTGFLVNTPEGAALRIHYLFHYRDQLQTMGKKAREFVRRNFLITRHLRDYLTFMVSIIYNVEERIELG